MIADSSSPIEALSDQLSKLYVELENLTEEGSTENLLKVLALLRDLGMSMRIFEGSAVTVLGRHDVGPQEISARLGGNVEDVLSWLQSAERGSGIVEKHLAALLAAHGSRSHPALVEGNIYTRSDLRELFEIRDATLNNGVFPLKKRHEVWLFVTEDKPADREQYLDKLVGETLYWQGQRMGRTDSYIINHKRTGYSILLFYRRAKYEFEGAAFRYEGIFEYISHSCGHPTDFVLRRVLHGAKTRDATAKEFGM